MNIVFDVRKPEQLKTTAELSKRRSWRKFWWLFFGEKVFMFEWRLEWSQNTRKKNFWMSFYVEVTFELVKKAEFNKGQGLIKVTFWEKGEDFFDF